MLRIRLRRSGKKNKPTYRLVVAEHTAPIGGKFIDHLGSYNPHTKALEVKKELVLTWLNKGALPSNTVARLLQKAAIDHSNIVVVNRPKKAPRKTPEATTKPAKEEVKDETEPEDKSESKTEAATETQESTSENSQTGENAE